MSNSITVRNKHYEVSQFIGTVTQREKQRETRVSSYGGGDTPIHTSSTTYIHDEVFLENEAGDENVLKLVDWDISVKEGNTVQTIAARKSGKKHQYYVAVQNISTGSIYWARKETLRRVFGYPALSGAALFWLLLIVCPAIGYWLGADGQTVYSYNKWGAVTGKHAAMSWTYFAVPFLVVFAYIGYFQIYLTNQSVGEAKAKLKPLFKEKAAINNKSA